MKLVAEPGVRVRPGSATTDTVSSGYDEEDAGGTQRAKTSDSTVVTVAHPCNYRQSVYGPRKHGATDNRKHAGLSILESPLRSPTPKRLSVSPCLSHAPRQRESFRERAERPSRQPLSTPFPLCPLPAVGRRVANVPTERRESHRRPSPHRMQRAYAEVQACG